MARDPAGTPRAYSLLEVLMAGSIFAVGFAAVISAVSTYMGVVEHDRKLGDAWRLLQGQAAHMRALPDTASEWTASSSITLDAFGRPGDAFTIMRIPVVDVPVTGARQMTLTARWTERAVERDTSLVLHR